MFKWLRNHIMTNKNPVDSIKICSYELGLSVSNTS
jgi:hypothetical protein